MRTLPFRVFRILFGAYLVVHFGMLVPYADEVFGMNGLLPNPRLNPLYGLFPNPLAVWDVATEVCVVLTLLSVCFACGGWRRSTSLLLWFGATALFHRNNLTANPSLAYIGLLLVLCALVPRDEKVPKSVLLCAQVLLAVGYTFSGITKWESPSWLDGSALARLMESPLAHDSRLREWMLSLPGGWLQIMTWGVLALEIAYLPLCIHAQGRKMTWMLMVALHLGILLLVDFADLTVGMLMVHLFVLEPQWLPQRLFRTASYLHEKTHAYS